MKPDVVIRDPRRVAFVQSVRKLMMREGVSFADLGRASSRDAATKTGVSRQYVEKLLDERMQDGFAEIQVRDLADWYDVLGPELLEAWAAAYCLPVDVVARAPGDVHDAGVLGATGEALVAAGELARETTAAIADGKIDSNEQARIEGAAERVARAGRGVAATTKQRTPAARRGT